MSLQQSGDQLGETGIIDKIKNILDNNRENLLIVAFVLIIIGGVWAYMQAPQKPDASSGAASEVGAQNEDKKDGENKTETSTPAEENKNTKVAQAETTATSTPAETTATPTATPTPTTTPEPAPAATSDGQSVTVTAAKGDGLTHAARKALKEYLTSASENLNSEQKIYIEDYLRKHSTYKTINPGEALLYSNDLIKTAVEKAKALNAAQLKNLEKYSKLVKNL